MNKEREKKIFMENLIKHPELLKNFSIDKLKIILEYYKLENEKKRKKLSKVN